MKWPIIAFGGLIGMDDLIAYKVVAAICGLFVGIELSLYFKEWIDRGNQEDL